MLPQNKPDRIRILFDDHRLVANAGLLLPATLARHLGLRELVDHHLDLGGAPGRANTGDKMLTLVASALAGGDCIDDADALRAGGTVGVLGCVVKAPSTLGTFLRCCGDQDTVPPGGASVGRRGAVLLPYSGSHGGARMAHRWQGTGVGVFPRGETERVRRAEGMPRRRPGWRTPRHRCSWMWTWKCPNTRPTTFVTPNL